MVKTTARQSGFRRLLRTKTFLFMNVAVFGLAGWNFIGEYSRGMELRQEIAKFERQAAALQDRQLTLAEDSRKLAQGQAIEREARLKLNLQKPGEEVVIIRNEKQVSRAGIEHKTDEVEPTDRPTDQKLSNPQKWWNYFFAAGQAAAPADN